MDPLKATDVWKIIRKRPIVVLACSIPCAVIGTLVPIVFEPKSYEASELIQVNPNTTLTQSELNDTEVVLKSVRSAILKPAFRKYMHGYTDDGISVSGTNDPNQVNLIANSPNPTSTLQAARRAGNYLSTTTDVVSNAETVDVIRPANAAIQSGYTLHGIVERSFLGLLVGLLLGIVAARKADRKP